MADIFGRVKYPEIENPISCSYTCSHGITPGRVALVAQPQRRLPRPEGTVTIFDGRRTFKLRDCRIEEVTSVIGSEGEEWTYYLSDRRWRWRDYGCISGWYNRLDPYGKLIQWTVRSPREMAVLCLQAMGEFDYVIDLPQGLSRNQANADIGRFLRPGENLPPTGLNPEVKWDGIPPGQALASLCDQFGRVVAYDARKDRVVIARPGVGAKLPDGESVARRTPSVGNPVVPDGIAVMGAPVRFQDRLELEPVGIEWDGSYRPIDELSYIPEWPATKTTWRVRVGFNEPAVDANPGKLRFVLYLTIFLDNRLIGGELHEIDSVLMAVANASSTPTTVVQELIDKFTAKFPAGSVFARSVRLDTPEAGVLRVQSLTSSWDVKVAVQRDNNLTGDDVVLSNIETVIEATQTAAYAPAYPSWGHADRRLFSAVRATDRLTKADAVRLAQDSIWRCYRLTGRDPSNNKLMLEVPGYGRIKRVQQIQLQDTRVEQVVPERADRGLINRNRPGEPVVVNFYNGLSRDKPAAVYGKHLNYQGTLWHMLTAEAQGVNTREGDQVHVNFTIDAEHQVIKFSDQVFLFEDVLGVNDRRIVPPKLLLETAFTVLNEETNAEERYVRVRRLKQPRGVANAVAAAVGDPVQFLPADEAWLVEHREDVQANIYREYSTEGVPGRVRMLEADPIQRAEYYLSAMAVKFVTPIGETAVYNGLVDVSCDGAISQVTYEVGGGSGITTTVSRNGEHTVWTPPYPARRRAERLDAVLRRLEDLIKQVGR